MFLLQSDTVKLECILTGVMREEGAEEDIGAELGRLTGGIYKMRFFITFTADEKLFGLCKSKK